LNFERLLSGLERLEHLEPLEPPCALKTGARQSGITHSAGIETGNKEKILTGMFLGPQNPLQIAAMGLLIISFRFWSANDWNDWN
jgi:hypothetical protein